MLKNETNGILAHYEWREGNFLFCRDHKGKVFRSVGNYETITSTSKKALFVIDEDFNAEDFKQPNAIQLYERKIKKIKVGTKEEFVTKISVSPNPQCCYECSDLAKDREKKELQSLPDCPDCYNSECPKYQVELNRIFKSSKKKHFYEVIGYNFAPFPPKPRTMKLKIDEQPFIERFNNPRYRNMLLADIKLLFQLQEESTIELCEFLAIVIKCYRENLESEQEVKTFQKIIEKLIRTAKTPSGKRHFYISENEEDKTYISKN